MSSDTDTLRPPIEADAAGVWRRKLIGLAVGVAAALAVYYLMPDVVPQGAAPGFNSGAARGVAATAVLMGVWWMTEALPLAATALIPLVAFPALGIAPIDEAAPPYASPVIFLFLGGFMMALAVQRWGLHRRVALRIIGWVGVRPKHLVLGLMLATALLSQWMSNTATVVMMLPIGLSVISLVRRAVPGTPTPRLATSIMLGIAYSASVGSLGTIIGTPPNAMLVGYMQAEFGISISFSQWMMVAFPMSVVFVAFTWWLLTSVVFKAEISDIPGGAALIAQERAALGPMSAQEKTVGVVFLATAGAWLIVPNVWPDGPITDQVIAICAALALFLLPGRGRSRLLDWKTAETLPWNILLLFGGGLSLASQISSSGLSDWLGAQMSAMASLPTWLLIFLLALVTSALTEFISSNTATAATLIPIVGGIAVGLGLSPLILAAPVALACSCAFCMPAATPPNAVVFSTGYVRIPDMLRAGVVLGVVAAVLATVVVYTTLTWVFGL